MRCALLEVPNELLLKILSLLSDPRDIGSLGLSCRAFQRIARSDEVWRDRVQDLVRLHLGSGSDVGVELWRAQDGVYAKYVHGLLSKGARYLGWWATTSMYRGRLFRISVRIRKDSSMILVGEEVSCKNGLVGEAKSEGHSPRKWKPQAAIWHGHGELSYLVPENHPSPDAGYSVDILHPILEYTPIFTFTREAGFTLTSDNRGTLPPSVPITLPLDFARRRQLRDTAGSSSDNSLSRTAERGPSFPSRVAVRAGLLRSVSKWGQEVPDSTITGTPRLQGQFLTAPSFTLQAGRSDRAAEGEVEIGQNGGSQAQTRRDGANIFYQNRLPSPQALQPDIILGNIGGNQLFRAFLEGVGAALPSAMRNTLFGDRTNEEEHDFFYPIRGPHLQHSPPVTRMNGPVFACSLKGLWVGCYAAHGYEFGSIVMRNVWTRIHTADEVALEQIYDNDDDEWQEDGTNAELGVVRETLAANLEGSIKRRRSILEFIKITGDTNVPAGQVSWVAVLPSEEDEDNINQSDAHRYANNDQVEPDLDKRLLPSILREDWENWSDIPPSTTRRNHGFNVPRWNEGSVQAAGRIAFNGFVDTRFIDAQATFVREKSGEVDEVRIRWCGAALSRAFLGKS